MGGTNTHVRRKNLHQDPVAIFRQESFLCGVAGETAMNITFPVLMKAFSVNTSTVQWVTTIYLLVVACVVPFICLSQAFIQDENYLSCRKIFCLS